ncbi:nucleoside phosphorylase domain-containing protein [Aspergillus karnatakaensis]|uniref:5'-methylthioadenosine/S-adenosylhomocysteine nucleosidase n=1 Tax=Aspergillus karnatakaensis TaxID=1810916 RepID=UPI003CCE4C90
MWSRYSKVLSEQSPPDQAYRDLWDTHRQSLGLRQIGGIKIDCSFLPDSKWGFLGDVPGVPAWLLYLQFQFKQLNECKLANASVEITFTETKPSHVQSLCRSSPGPVVTDYYGPRDITRGQFDELNSPEGYDTDDQWSLRAYTWPVEGDESGLHRRVEWIIKEGHPSNRALLHHDKVKVGLVLRHDSDPFLVTVRIEGELRGNRGWFRFPSTAQSSTKSVSIRVSPSAKELTPLDTIADRLNSDMTALILQNIHPSSRSLKRSVTEKLSEERSQPTKRPRVHGQASLSPPQTQTKQVLHERYTIGWICALPIELAAARGMLDDVHEPLPSTINDSNSYTLGSIGPHNIVISCLPAGVAGPTSAATVAIQMTTTFPHVRFSLMVGIGGGVPSNKNDIRLGDIVVSKPTGRLGGALQYDYGKTVAGGRFEQTGALNKPPQVLLTTIARLQAEHILGTNHIESHLDGMRTKYPALANACRPGRDSLFRPEYEHDEPSSSCNGCELDQTLTREPRPQTSPKVHYGVIASGNQVIKHAGTRDRIAREHGILCFEMEAAGLMDSFPCLIIRGISDYADSHKNDDWQPYAAATAAAYAKEFLLMTPVRQVEITPRASWA